MAESCQVNAELSRKLQTEILRRLASVGQKALGEAIGKSETWVSRWKSDDLTTCADLLTALGLKTVQATNHCYSPEYMEHLHFFAKIGIMSGPSEPPLIERRADQQVDKLWPDQ